MNLVNKERETINESLWGHVETVNISDVNNTRADRTNPEVSKNSKFFAQ